MKDGKERMGFLESLRMGCAADCLSCIFCLVFLVVAAWVIKWTIGKEPVVYVLGLLKYAVAQGMGFWMDVLRGVGEGS